MSKTRKHSPAKQPQNAPPVSSMSPTTMDILCILFLYAVTLALFHGIIFDNAAFSSQGDTANAASYAHAGKHIEETEHVDPIWMPYFFSGMPTFGNVAYIPHNVSYVQTVIVTVLNFLYLNGRWTWLVVFYFLGGVSTFFLMRVWKFSRIAALFAAFTVMLSPYAINLAGEGHGSKLMALSYLPLVFLLTHQLFERRDLLSFGLCSAAIGTLMLTNHMQIVYYVFMLLGLYLVYLSVGDFPKDKQLVVKRAALFAGALLIGFCISSYIYLSVYEYSQFSIRGGGTAGATGGLTFDYATNWSWNPWELFTLFIPAFFGFQHELYWGTMPFTNATVYVGVLPVLLSILALVYNRNRTTIFLAIATAIVFLMSFGKHFSLLYELLFNYLPFFNKFRAPSMILHLLPFTLGIMGAYGFTFLLEAGERLKEPALKKLKRTLTYIGAGLLGALVLGFLLKSAVFDTLSGFMFLKDGEYEQYRQHYAQQTAQVIAQLKQLRFDLLWKDCIKFVIIASASLGAIVLFLNGKIRETMFSFTMVAILLIDLLIVINSGKFINPTPVASLDQSFQPDETIQFLKQQPEPFRVFPVGQLFMDNTYAYHAVQSIGGYSAAKLKIYQTLLDSCMYASPDPAFPLNMNIVNMLNVRYLIVPGQLPGNRFELVHVDQARRLVTYKNPEALPRAYFVRDVITAGSAHEVFQTLNSPQFHPATSAVIEKPLQQQPGKPDSAHAEVAEFTSRKIVINAYTSSPALLVSGEVYYPAGWNAYIDDVPTEIFKTNYILRSVVVPEGNHRIVFAFEPSMYKAGWLASNAAWGVTLVCTLIGLWRLPAVRARLGRKPPVPAKEKENAPL